MLECSQTCTEASPHCKAAFLILALQNDLPQFSDKVRNRIVLKQILMMCCCNGGRSKHYLFEYWSGQLTFITETFELTNSSLVLFVICDYWMHDCVYTLKVNVFKLLHLLKHLRYFNQIAIYVVRILSAHTESESLFQIDTVIAESFFIRDCLYWRTLYLPVLLCSSGDITTRHRQLDCSFNDKCCIDEYQTSYYL